MDSSISSSNSLIDTRVEFQNANLKETFDRFVESDLSLTAKSTPMQIYNSSNESRLSIDYIQQNTPVLEKLAESYLKPATN